MFEGRQGIADDRRRSVPLTNLGFLMNFHVCRGSDLMQTIIIPKETLDSPGIPKIVLKTSIAAQVVPSNLH